MSKLLVICGPTATGKTAIAIKLAKKFNGEILSADSRQVYKRMNIGTGKDITHAKYNPNLGYYEKDGIKIWGLDLVEPNCSFNVSDYLKYATTTLISINKRNHLPIIAGGTGQYIKEILSPSPTIGISPNQDLRRQINTYPLVKLQQVLRKLNHAKWEKMNNSDRINPRRLVRAIEVATFLKKGGSLPVPYSIIKDQNVLTIGLSTSRELLYQAIDRRVETRLEQGMESEVRLLLTSPNKPNTHAFSATGYRDFFAILKKSNQVLSSEDMSTIVQKWKFSEHAYARRQLTWFTKDSKINWFDISIKGWQEKVAELVANWYN